MSTKTDKPPTMILNIFSKGVCTMMLLIYDDKVPELLISKSVELSTRR